MLVRTGFKFCLAGACYAKPKKELKDSLKNLNAFVVEKPTKDTTWVISTDPDNSREGIYFICLPQQLRPGKPEKIAAPKCDADYLYTVYFERGKSNVSPSDAEAVVKFLRQRNATLSYTLSLQGFTCDVGDSTANNRLASRRIAAVEQIIRKGKLKFKNITRKSLGESTLGDKILSDPERTQARRVEVRLEKIVN